MTPDMPPPSSIDDETKVESSRAYLRMKMMMTGDLDEDEFSSPSNPGLRSSVSSRNSSEALRSLSRAQTGHRRRPCFMRVALQSSAREQGATLGRAPQAWALQPLRVGSKEEQQGQGQWGRPRPEIPDNLWRQMILQM